jgi:putative Holliday junction resolvase
MRFLGVDPGGKRLGLAVGDDETGIVSPLGVVEYRGVEAAVETIRAHAQRHGAERFVVGLPTTACGEPTPACRRSHALAESLAAHGLSVEFQSEHLSTNEARRRAREAGLPAGRPVDHLAAQVLLEEFLAARQPPAV